MHQEMLNQTLLPHNDCFGCGHENPHGLQIEIFRDRQRDDRLKGIFRPASHMIGFPGITHGGTLYTALDCMAAWVGMALRGGNEVLWLLRSAQITYHKPARPGQAIQLTGIIEEEGGPLEAMTVRTEAHNDAGDLLADGKFKIVPLTEEKFKKVTGVEEIPKNWKFFMGLGKEIS